MGQVILWTVIIGTAIFTLGMVSATASRQKARLAARTHERGMGMSEMDNWWYNQCAVISRRNEELNAKVAALEAENAEWAKWGIVEIAVRNPNVSAYMDHWEGRAVKAEAENGRLRDALKSAAPVINCLDVYGRYLPVRYLIADALAQQPSPAQGEE